MHPDEAVQLAMRDLRSRAPNATPPAAPPPHRALDLLRAYVSPLQWYVKDGRTPVAADSIEVGHLPRPHFLPEAAEGADDAALLPVALGVEP
jgi:hypothetical protein